MRAVACLILALAACTAAWAAPHAHEHGVVQLAVAVDGARVSIDLDAPLDGLLGFERAPRSDAEKKAAAELLALLQQPERLFRLDAAAGCKPGAAEIKADVLQPGARPAADDHAELEAQFSFDCAKPAALRQLDLGLFDAFKRLQRIDVQVAGAKSQAKVTLKRPARVVPLVR